MRAVAADQELQSQGAKRAIKMGRPERCTTIGVKDLLRFAHKNDACFIGSDHKLRVAVKFKGNGGQRGYLLIELHELLKTK